MLDEAHTDHSEDETLDHRGGFCFFNSLHAMILLKSHILSHVREYVVFIDYFNV